MECRQMDSRQWTAVNERSSMDSRQWIAVNGRFSKCKASELPELNHLYRQGVTQQASPFENKEKLGLSLSGLRPPR